MSHWLTSLAPSPRLWCALPRPWVPPQTAVPPTTGLHARDTLIGRGHPVVSSKGHQSRLFPHQVKLPIYEVKQNEVPSSVACHEVRTQIRRCIVFTCCRKPVATDTYCRCTLPYLIRRCGSTRQLEVGHSVKRCSSTLPSPLDTFEPCSGVMTPFMNKLLVVATRS